MRIILLAWTLYLLINVAGAQPALVDNQCTTSLVLVNGQTTIVIDVNITLAGKSFDDYWTEVVDKLFDFADADQSGTITEKEISLLPSARAIRLSQGSGFTPPVAKLESVSQLTDSGANVCTRDDLRHYYQREGVGVITMGYGELPLTEALTDRIIEALDADQNGSLSQHEWANAEDALRKLDTNDDELISATELLPAQIYPGCSATQAIDRGGSIIRPASQPGTLRLVARIPCDGEDLKTRLRQLGEPKAPNLDGGMFDSIVRQTWNISRFHSSDQESLTAPVNGPYTCEAWVVPGPLPTQFQDLAERIDATDVDQLAWLLPMVDRDANGSASGDELARWLAIQERIANGQVLISVLSGGGLFERLDQDHDARLAARELRDAWDVLTAASCTTDDHLDRNRIPMITWVVASRGYPHQIRKSKTSTVEWFRLMDRNQDGDISRREFTESSEHFTRFDHDQDGLISLAEADEIESTMNPK